MAFGPLTIFDKSFLQGLNQYESVWFDNFFRTIITPLFFVETLADLEKEVSTGKTPQQVVGQLAFKTPDINSIPNVHHFNLLVSNLLGYPVEMRRRPIISGGIPKVSEKGYSLYFKEFPEAEAFRRWQNEEFLETERDFAKTWRAALANPEFEGSIAMASNTVSAGKRFSDLTQIKSYVNSFLENTTIEYLYLLFEIIDIPIKARSRILKRWHAEGKPKLSSFAPYAHFVFSIDLFFYIGAAHGHIAKERTSNKVDIAYLYYLPFSHMLISNDNLHKRTASLFMESDQMFLTGDEIKPDLMKLDDYYEKLPQEVKNEGIMRFATYPPHDIETKIAELWDKYLPAWRKHDQEERLKPRGLPSSDPELMKRLRSVKTAPRYTGRMVSSDDAESVTISRMIRSRKGKWRTVPKEVEDKVNKEKQTK